MIAPVTVSIDIPQPRADVYAFLDVMANHESFTDHMLVDWSCSGPESGVGSRATVTAKFGGMSDKAEIEVIEVEEGRLIRERNVAAKGRRIATGTYALSDLPDGGTRVEFTFAFERVPGLRAAARAAHAQDAPARERARDDPPRRAAAERGRRRVTDVEFLQWALPRVGLRWAGFRKVRRQVLRRLRRRVGALGLSDLDAYREYLGAHPAEWGVFEALTPVTISRFYRDRAVFEALERVVLGGRRRVGWARCGRGARPAPRARRRTRSRWGGGLGVDVLATDVDPTMLGAPRARYDASSLRELPAPLRERGFDGRRGFALRPGSGGRPVAATICVRPRRPARSTLCSAGTPPSRTSLPTSSRPCSLDWWARCGRRRARRRPPRAGAAGALARCACCVPANVNTSK